MPLPELPGRSPQTPLKPSPVNLRPLARDMLDRVRGIAEKKGVTLRLDIDPALPKVVEADRLQLQQALSHLLANAVKYTERGTVSLRIKPAATDAGRVTLHFSVTDTGAGVAAADLPNIQREFGRIEEDAARALQGTGLRLAIVQCILNAMNTRLKIDRSPEGGSTFGFALTVPFVVATHAAEEAFPLAGLTIVYAEDEPMIRLVTSRRLSGAGAHVIEAEDGIVTLEKIAASNFDFLLLDLNMPRLDGVDVIHRLATSGKLPFPIFVLTAHIAGEKADAALRAGATKVFNKPIQIEVLAATYQAWCTDESQTGQTSGAKVAPTMSQTLDNETFRSVLTQSDAAFAASLLETFTAGMRADVAGLREAVASGDADKARAISHRAVGICQVLGAARLARIFRGIEEAAETGDLASIVYLSEACPLVLEATIAAMNTVASEAAA